MDTRAQNRQVCKYYNSSSENAEINTDSIIVALAELNFKILRLRKEIVALKDENKIHLAAVSRSTPSKLNNSAKNGKRRTVARYELQRNFKGDDSPGSTDLSARLSFAKRAQEVKAANETAVFKEDYPRDDKSIEDDERPNRSRVSESLGTYREFISDGKKFRKETGERSRDVRDLENVRISWTADEKLKKFNKNEVICDTYCDCSSRNVIVSKIKKKRISRGVQYDISFKHQSRVSLSFLSCFRSTSSAKKSDKKNFNIKSQNDVNKPSDTVKIKNESSNVTDNEKERELMSNTDLKKEKFENDDKKIEQITDIIDDGNRKGNNNSKYYNMKNLFEKWLNKVSTRKNNLKAQQSGPHQNFNSADDLENKEKDIIEPSFENKRTNDDCERDNHPQSVSSAKFFYHKINSNNVPKSVTENSDGENNVNKVKKRLDLCIIELNEIIGDAYKALGAVRARKTNS